VAKCRTLLFNQAKNMLVNRRDEGHRSPATKKKWFRSLRGQEVEFGAKASQRNREKSKGR